MPQTQPSPAAPTPPLDALPHGRLPRDFYLEDFPPGRRFELGSIVASEQEIIDFASDFDPQTFHTDPQLAVHSGFQGLVASGWHTAGLCTRLVCAAFLAKTDCLGSPGVRSIRWLQPVRPGMELVGSVEVLEQNFSRTKPDRGLTVQRWELRDTRGEPVFECDMMIVFGRRPTSAASPTAPAAALDDWRRQAQSLWFGDGSCTGGKPE